MVGGRVLHSGAVAEEQTLAPGLYLVGTPIGNLEDITLRAIRVLKQVDLIACEDTRQTQKLLNHFAIETPTISYHEHNEASRAEELVAKLARGARIAIVSDAGMPGVSDPGFRVVSQAIARGIPVVPVPGPAAFASALVASGLAVEPFTFRGFLPSKRGARRRELEKVRALPETQVFYEAPHRLAETLQEIGEVLGMGRRIAVARELTKLHEEFLRGTVAEVLETLQRRGEVKGEITLLIAPAEAGEVAPRTQSMHERVQEIMGAEGLDEKSALKKAAKERGISKSEAYRMMQNRS